MSHQRRITIAEGITLRGEWYAVRASIGSGKRRTYHPQEKLRRDAAETKPPIAELKAMFNRQKMWLNNELAKAGDSGRVVRGLVSGDIETYLGTDDKPGAATLNKRRRQERRQQLAWWAERFGTRRRSEIKSHELLAALNSLKKSASTKNKYLQAFSHVWTILDGKNAPNPFREFPRFVEPEAARRDQPYELIDAILAKIRDRGRGRTPSRTKAFLMVEAHAPVTRAELSRMVRTDVDWTTGEFYTPGRKKGAGTRGMKKPRTSAEQLAAFRAFDAADCWGRTPSRSSIWRTFTAARDAAIAELKETRPDLDLSRAATMRPYDLRHSFLTVAHAKTGDLALTAALAGHKDLKTTKRYAQGAIPVLLQAAGEAIAAAFAARPKYEPPAANTAATGQPGRPERPLRIVHSRAR